MIDRKEHFFNDQRIIEGPWAAFERDFARLLLFQGFDDVRLVNGPGDKGADIIGAINNELWVFQSKYRKNAQIAPKAVSEAVGAAEFYGADRIGVVISRAPTESFRMKVAEFSDMGYDIDVFGPKKISNLANNSPLYPPSRKDLRKEYQVDVAEDFFDGLTQRGKSLIVLATGLGKTVVMSEVVTKLFDDQRLDNERVLVVAHTRPLVRQLIREFWDQLPKYIPTHILMGGEFPSFFKGITFATIQSVKNNITMLPKFDAVFIDEAHHAGAPSFVQTIDKLDPKMLGGVTATPWRGDGFNIELLFNKADAKVGIAEGLAHGFLSKTDYRLIADDIDWEFVQNKSKNKYSVKQLNKRLLIPERDEKAASIIKEVFINEKRTSAIIFSPSIDHATQFAGWLNHVGLKAACIFSSQKSREQELIMSKFKSGQFDVVVTVDMFNEGVDIPNVDLVAFLRATHSRRIFVQQLGRGLRVSDDKDKVIVLDFVSDLRRMALVLDLDKSVKSLEIEKVGLGDKLINFNDKSAGSFLEEWLLDQADLFKREEDPALEIPEKFNYPEPIAAQHLEEIKN